MKGLRNKIVEFTVPKRTKEKVHTLTNIGSMNSPDGMESRYFFRSIDRNSKTRYNLDSCISTSSRL